MATFNVQAATANWQNSGIDVPPGRTLRVVASGTWGIIDPPHRGVNGPGGDGVTSGNGFVAPGQPEGCLLMKLGDGSVKAFRGSSADSSVSDPIDVSTPGRLSFIANDQTGPGPGSGFHDNNGSLTVTTTDVGPAPKSET